MSQLIPAVLMRPRIFFAREYDNLDEETKRWIRDTEASDMTLDEQIIEWQRAFRPDIRYISAPGTQMYKINETRQLVIVSVSIMYVPSVEESDDQAMEGLAGVVKPRGEASPVDADKKA